MESIGKERDLNNRQVFQGLAVYGNKGATDQHSYIQQLRDGQNNFFAVFVEVLKDRDGESFYVENGITSGDYLSGFFLGTREALFENGRQSVSITIPRVSAFSVGALIALFERSVGFYANLIGINAYHQPGVEAGKKAAQSVINLQKQVVELLAKNPEQGFSVKEIAATLRADVAVESIFKICEHLVVNKRLKKLENSAGDTFSAKYGIC